MIEDLIERMFHARNAAHIAHWKTKSYAEHKALGEYYGGILDLTDSLTETYFGTIGKRLNFKIPQSEYMNSNQHLTQLKEYVVKHRGVFGMENTHIQNIIDEIIGLITQTLYLLTLT